MFTQCPECEIAFRVSAKILQQAAGNVRCGSCSHAFNALHYLSEEMPELTVVEDDEIPDTDIEHDDLAETSRRLLQTLDELAGSEDVRIEDTGVEWRVLDDAVADRAEPVLTDTGHPEKRYDDNTPLPEDFVDDSSAYSSPLRRTEDHDKPGIEFEERQGDLALSEPEDWTDLLDEFRGSEPDSFEIQEELAAIHHQLSAREVSADSKSVPVDLDTQFDTQAEAMGLDISSPENELTDEVPHLDESDLEFETVESDIADDDEVEDGGDEDEFDTMEALYDVEEPEGRDDELDDDDDTGVFELEEDEDESEEDDDEDPDADEEEDDHEVGDDDGDDSSDWESTGEFEEKIDVAARELAGDLTADEEAEDPDTELEDEADVDDADEPYDLEDDEDESDELSLDGDEASPFAEHVVPDQTEEEMTVNMEIDEELMAAADRGEDFTATLVGIKTPEQLFDEHSDEVETIIMEGEFVRSAVEKERMAAERSARSQLDDPSRFADTYATNREKLRGGRRRYDPPGTSITIAIVALALLLAGQLIHNSRESLATYGFFNQTVAPLYRVLGQPVTPEWDIKGWQFEATNGSVGAEETTLTIVSRIGNKAAEALPYPLIHVSLTNRFEDIMGSRVLEPGEYLAGDLDPSSPVLPGENFTAVITIEEPSADATGFKLNVCYRVKPGTVRCAIEDFKN